MNVGLIMHYKQKHNRGYLLAEAIVALMVLGILLGVLSSLLASVSQASIRIFARQKCIAAALAQLDSVDFTGQPLNAEQIEALWSGVQVELEQTPGTESNVGLIKYTATAYLFVGETEIFSQQTRFLSDDSVVEVADNEL